ncbi:M67 family metallopeptidase [Paenibacillus gallinarum]|uniref:M67 family metallopeptidase n=1 Tax=Paenibacillus gallinarum TaxID=2762232 RepID=A0ABR8SU99_9BACL|nr:M67 family metallopeptidase [Paenibacillus gallinarum]MBD7967075.1 M67 family metallopeptidase [Paenibacillus gallinarum]
MIIRMTAATNEQIKNHFHTSWPSEGCGLLLGTSSIDDSVDIHSIIPIKNVAADPTHHFELEPKVWVHHLLTSPDLIGLFHTHPVSAPLPSAEDLQNLQSYGQLMEVYLIAGIDPKAQLIELTAYEVVQQDHRYCLRPAALCVT